MSEQEHKPPMRAPNGDLCININPHSEDSKTRFMVILAALCRAACKRATEEFCRDNDLTDEQNERLFKGIGSVAIQPFADILQRGGEFTSNAASVMLDEAQQAAQQHGGMAEFHAAALIDKVAPYYRVLLDLHSVACIAYTKGEWVNPKGYTPEQAIEEATGNKLSERQERFDKARKQLRDELGKYLDKDEKE